MASSTLISDTEQWKDLKAHVDDINMTHLRELMSDTERCKSMILEFDGILLDYLRQCATLETVDKLFKLAEAACLKGKINEMFNGERINCTENRPILHVALRAPRDATGKALKNVISIGIGGSFLGPLFVHTALQTEPEAIKCARGCQLRFLANVDPIDVARNITGLNPETTLVVVVSKTFTTVETM